MSFTHVQDCNATTASAASAAATFGSSVTAGNLLVATLGILNGSASPTLSGSVADNKGNTWTRAAVHAVTQGGGLPETLEAWYAIVATGGSGVQVTLTPSASGFMNLSVSEYSFTDTGSLRVYSAAQNKQTGSLAVNTGTIAHDGSSSNLMVGIAAHSDGDAGETWSAGTATNLRASHSFVGGSAVGFGAGDALDPTADQAINFTLSGSSSGVVTEALGVCFSFAATAQPYRYVSTSFDGFNGLCVAGNDDAGGTWNAIPLGGYSARYTPNGSDVCRDPSSVIRAGGTYFVAHSNTNGTATNTVTIASSVDLIAWTFVGRVDFAAVIGSSNANRCVVGPQFLIDSNGDIYLFAAGSATYFSSIASNVIMWCKATDTTGLTAWGAASSLTLTGADTGSLLDPFLVAVAGTYYLYYASGNTICRASSATVTGTYAEIGTITTSRESPCVLNMGDPNWRLFLDNLGSGEFTADTAGGIAGTFGSQTAFPAYLTNTMVGLSVADLAAPAFPAGFFQAQPCNLTTLRM